MPRDYNTAMPASPRSVADIEGFVDLLLDLDRSLTPAQRRLAVAKLRDYADDFRQLTSRRVLATN